MTVATALLALLLGFAWGAWWAARCVHVADTLGFAVARAVAIEQARALERWLAIDAAASRELVEQSQDLIRRTRQPLFQQPQQLPLERKNREQI